MWIPCWCWNDRTFLRQWPTSSAALPRPGHQHCARALPSSSSERSCDWECWTWCLLWPHLRERQMGREGRNRQIKDRGREEQADSTDLNISFLNKQQSLSSLCLFMPQCCFRNRNQTAGKWPKTFTDIIWYNGTKHTVALWDCVSQLYLFSVVSSI